MRNRCSGAWVAFRLRTVREGADPRPAGTESHDHVRTTAKRRPGRSPYPLSQSQIHRPTGRWQSGQSQFAGDGVPAWTVQNGVVYLSGSVVQTSGTNNEFAVLPPAARPSRVLYMTVFTVAGTQGFIIVHPSGAIQAWATPYSNAQGLTSLAGVSYPAPALATHKLALENGWQSSQSQWGTGDPSYSVSNGVVYLSGSLLQPSATATGQMFAVLPNAARPVHYLYIKAMVWSPGSVANTGTVVITPNGEMYAYSLTASEAQQYTSLAGISYPLGS